jgi:hypothetical protein
MTEQEQFNRIFWSAYREAKRARVIDGVAYRHAYATALLWWYYRLDEPGRPDIVSGFRSPARQQQLLTQWQSGDTRGLVAKPACSSWHTVGRAIDVESDVRGFPAYAFFLERFGMRDGRNFSDPGHFDLPGPTQPPNICTA